MASDSVVAVDRLAVLEDVIERGLETFVEVGQALMEIRDSRLYRESHQTFEDYCQERWSFSRQRAHQLMQGAEVSRILDTQPPNAGVAAELAPLRKEPEELRETWGEVVDLHGPKPTAKQVREVVDKKRDRMAVHYSSETDEWATPQDFFDVVNAEFAFELDVCALESSNKCPNYFSPEANGLAQNWVGTCWMNPPYGNEIVDWVRKAYESSLEGATVVCLVPARVDTGWWWDYCRHGEVRFLRGRLKFGGSDTSAPFPSALVVFGETYAPDTVYWEWR